MIFILISGGNKDVLTCMNYKIKQIHKFRSFCNLRTVIPHPVTSQSHAKTRRLCLKQIHRDEDKTKYSPHRYPHVRSNLSPHQCQGATIIQDVKHAGSAVVHCRHQNHECQNLKPK